MEALVEALMQWIGDHSDLKVANLTPPEIVMMSPEELTREFYSDAPDLLPEDGVDDRVNALYAASDGQVGTIYLLAPEAVPDAKYYDDPMENPFFREVLLHELVHHVQWQTKLNESWACPREGEKQAYILGGRYLHAVGATDPLPNRMFWAHMYSLC
ncbi:DUF6647 family protein [Thioclava pacifica]|uniref:DUF2268 domain-containing protein n=1 Tax=Thioclava pacifica DSM 10166 TaxID=1353537 RepID=A0A074JF82_9RHOB|nr:DUF6647 family protein [Thioclava pacifica]KEO55169.1 hypothetical protein TP2_16455 [Thioclava pacifica DSM 10166]